MLYPQQVDKGFHPDDVQYIDGSIAETVSSKISSVGKAKGIWKKLFKPKQDD
jgi:hypothetical protein